MLRKFSFLAIIAMVCMIFAGLTLADPLNRRQQGGAVAYCDFTDAVTGRFTWTNIPGGKCRTTGQFNTGFESANVDEYTFFLEDKDENKIQDLTEEIRGQIHINPPGTSPFECDFPFDLTSVEDVEGLCFVVKHEGKTLSKALIEKV